MENAITKNIKVKMKNSKKGKRLSGPSTNNTKSLGMSSKSVKSSLALLTLVGGSGILICGLKAAGKSKKKQQLLHVG